MGTGAFALESAEVAARRGAKHVTLLSRHRTRWGQLLAPPCPPADVWTQQREPSCFSPGQQHGYTTRILAHPEGSAVQDGCLPACLPACWPAGRPAGRQADILHSLPVLPVLLSSPLSFNILNHYDPAIFGRWVIPFSRQFTCTLLSNPMPLVPWCLKARLTQARLLCFGF